MNDRTSRIEETIRREHPVAPRPSRVSMPSLRPSAIFFACPFSAAARMALSSRKSSMSPTAMFSRREML